MVQDEGAAMTTSEGEPRIHTNPVSSVFYQIMCEESFEHEQKEDDQLKYCLSHECQVEGVNVDPE